MGSNSTLYIGEQASSWKNIIPEFIAFLFEPQDYTSTLEVIDNGGWYQHRFVTSCGQITKRLEKYNINLQMLRNIYFSFFRFNFNGYIFSLEHRCRQYITKRHPGLSEDEIHHKGKRMANLLLVKYFDIIDQDSEFNKVLSSYACSGTYRDYVVRLENYLADLKEERLSLSNKTPINLDSPDFYRRFLKDLLEQDPYLQSTHSVLENSSGSTDIDVLFRSTMSIYASNPDVPVEFDFTEFVDVNEPMSIDEVSLLISDFRSALHARSSIVYAAFGKSVSQTNLALTFSTTEVQVFQTTKEKGDILESLVAKIFSAEPGFVVRQNVKRSGEEIDLVIKNKIDDPFWNGLQSPVILVECKHHKNKIEPKDLRNFEVKIMDRRNLCRLGIMVSTSGFTRGCYEAATRSSRDGHRIILIDAGLLEQRINTHKSTADWLEDIIIDQI